MTSGKIVDVILYRKAKQRIQALLAGTGKQVLLIGIEDKCPQSVTHVVGAVKVHFVENEESNCLGSELGIQERIEKISEHLVPGLNIVGTAAREGGGILKCGAGIDESNRFLRMSIDIDGSLVCCVDEKTHNAMHVSETEGCIRDHFRCVRCRVDLAVRLCGGKEHQGPLSRFLDSLRNGSVDFILNKSTNGDELSLIGDSESPERTSWQDPLLVRAMLMRRADISLCAPSLTISNEKENVSWSTAVVDVLCTIPKRVSGSRLAQEYIMPAMLEQGQKIKAMASSGRYGPAHHFRAFHFWPEDYIDFPICILYPINDASESSGEEDLAPTRKLVHIAYGLPLNRPMLRTSSALFFDSPELEVSDRSAAPSGRKGEGKIHDVDQGLGRASNVRGTVHRIRGHYEYYHYLHDNIDDCGWGCAYRSLQTICSWFRLQGYSSREPPSHREIQTVLVKLGDKTKEFIGSKKWIGAIELGYILDSLYNIQSRIITVSDGCNMSSVAREIGLHFDTQGTPIMIGGGVLAYTLLGIDYNEDTGDCAYLILDPHYTGTDDKEKIQNSKWVAWKQIGDKAAAGGDLFVSGAFYNLLCPQCPSEI